MVKKKLPLRYRIKRTIKEILGYSLRNDLQSKTH